MFITVKSKFYGIQTIDTETFDTYKISRHCTIWRIFEYLFEKWYDSATEPGRAFAKDVAGCYNGYIDQPAIYTRAGAIQQGIEAFFEICEEDNLTFVTTKQINAMDIEPAFDI